MKFTSIFLLGLVTLGYASASNQAAVSIPPAGEAVTPTLNNAPKSNVEGKTFFLIANVLKSVCRFLFGDHSQGSYGDGGYYNGNPYYSGLAGWNGPNQFYGDVDNYYTIFSPDIKYFDNGDGTSTLFINKISGVQGSNSVQFTCPASTFKISRSGNGYLCQIFKSAACNVRYA